MIARIDTILIIGATRGIGKALAQRFHAMGKTVIATGRAQDKDNLATLARQLTGLETREWDLTDLTNLKAHVTGILADFPTLDTVFINAGIQNHYLMFDDAPVEHEVVREITTNLTGPTLVAHYFVPHLLGKAQAGTKTNLFLTASSLAYFPVPFYPTYCATKAGLSAFTKVLRMQLAYTCCNNMSVVEVVPPYVDTDLNAAHREATDNLQGGKDRTFPPMPLQEYIDQFFVALEQTQDDGNFKKEIGVGLGAQGIDAWRGTFEKLYEGMGMGI